MNEEIKIIVKNPEYSLKKITKENFSSRLKLKVSSESKSFDDIKLEDIDLDHECVHVIDFRECDLSEMNFENKLDILQNSIFSTLTIFPKDEQMPYGFKEEDREKILELGKYKDLGLSELRQQGITGKNIKVAILDQSLNIDHPEIKERVREYYSFSDDESLKKSSMHGIAVSSILCGKEIGISPDIDLYYFAAPIKFTGSKTITFKYYLEAFNKLIEINKNLEKNDEEPIKIISVSAFLCHQTSSKTKENKDEETILREKREQQENKDMQEILNTLKKMGISVFYVGMAKGNPDCGVFFDGIKRSVENSNSFELAHSQINNLNIMSEISTKYNNPPILVPMDSRTYGSRFISLAEPEKTQFQYEGCNGGMSWVIPYAAGLFALSRQIQPNIVLEDFHKIAQNTGKDLIINGVFVGKIIQPLELVREVRYLDKLKSQQKTFAARVLENKMNTTQSQSNEK